MMSKEVNRFVVIDVQFIPRRHVPVGWKDISVSVAMN